MKTLRFIGMAIVAIIMSVNFVACSDDDDDIDVSQLEGTWGFVLNMTMYRQTLNLTLNTVIVETLQKHLLKWNKYHH